MRAGTGMMRRQPREVPDATVLQAERQMPRPWGREGLRILTEWEEKISGPGV